MAFLSDLELVGYQSYLENEGISTLVNYSNIKLWAHYRPSCPPAEECRPSPMFFWIRAGNYAPHKVIGNSLPLIQLLDSEIIDPFSCYLTLL